MAYTPNSSRLSKTNTRDKLRASADLDFGIYIGEVIVRPKDSTHSGRIPVYIPMLGKDRDDPSGYYYAYWTSPFAGSTPSSKLGENTDQFSHTQKSYGMWMVPPDPGNFVLVAFADGKKKFPIIVSCLFPDQLQFMVPGNPATAVPGAIIASPAAEINRRVDNPNHGYSTVRPLHPNTTLPILNQGLLLDPVRGTTTSSARRESPSEVFGILTPGPDKISPDSSKVDGTNRMGGHSFVMDDNLDQRHVRLRSGGGAQILMDDTNELLYVINHRGTAWAEINAAGDINLYSDRTYTVRARGDINLRSDSNVNIDAKFSVNVNAGDPDPSGQQNGQINLQSSGVINNKTRGGGFNVDVSDDGPMDVFATGPIRMSTATSMNLTSSESTFLTSSSSMNFRAGAEINSQASGRNNVLGSTVHLNDGGSAGSASPPTAVQPLETFGFQEPPNTAPEFDYNEDAVSGSTNPFPTDGKRPGDNGELITICTELTTREPWYGHIAENSQQGNIISLDADYSAQSTAANLKPQSISGDLEPPIQPAVGRPGDVVPLIQPVGYTLPNGSRANLMPYDQTFPTGTVARFAPISGIPDNTQVATTVLESAQKLGDPGNTEMADLMSRTADMQANIITTTPFKQAVGSPIQAINKLRDYKNRGFDNTTENDNYPEDKLIGHVIGKNHFISPEELDRNVIIQGNPGNYVAGETHAGPVVIKPKAELPFRTSSGRTMTIDQVSSLVKERRFSELRSAGLTETASGWQIADTQDPGRFATVYQLDRQMSDQDSIDLLKADLNNARLFIGKSLVRSPGLSKQHFISLTSFGHGVGYSNWLRSGVLGAVQSGNMAQVPTEIQRWNRSNTGKLDPVWLFRRASEARLFVMPDDVLDDWFRPASSWSLKEAQLMNWSPFV